MYFPGHAAPNGQCQIMPYLLRFARWGFPQMLYLDTVFAHRLEPSAMKYCNSESTCSNIRLHTKSKIRTGAPLQPHCVLSGTQADDAAMERLLGPPKVRPERRNSRNTETCVNGLLCCNRSDRHAKLPLHEQELNARCPNRVGCEGEMTGHGFRCLASTILNEKVYERAHIEMQLAHVPNKEVEVAYNNALYERNVAS